MSLIVHDPTAPDMVTPPVSEVDFDFTAIPVETVVSGATTGQTVAEDATLDTRTGATIDHGWQITANGIGTPITSGNAAVATVGANGFASRVSDGTVAITAKSNGLVKGANLAFLRQTGQTTNTFASWVSGSAAAHMTDNVESRISGKSPSTSTLNVFSTVNHATASYVRNASLWCADYAAALTGCNAWQSGYGTGDARAQTAITPRHIVGAAHYFYPVTIGGTMRFVTADGTVVDRTVTHTKSITGTDIQLSILSADLPGTITPVKLLPTGWADYLRNLQYGIPCLLRNQFGEARIYDWNALSATSAYFTATMPASRSGWYRLLDIGDSGGPAMAMVNGELGLVTTWTGIANGPAYQAVDWATEIAAVDALASVSTGYLPGRIDLSSFTNFN